MQAWCGNDGIRNLWYKNDLSGGSTGYLAYYNLFNVEDNQLIVSVHHRLDEPNLS